MVEGPMEWGVKNKRITESIAEMKKKSKYGQFKIDFLNSLPDCEVQKL